jgi:hypothetical protein
VTNYIIGIDPGTTSGLALVEVARKPVLVWAWARKNAHPTSEIRRLPAGTKAVMEDQYIDVTKRGGSSVISLARWAGRWLEALDVLGIPVELVAASTWQAAMLRGMRAGRDRAAVKRAAVEVCKLRWGVKLTQDAADAALIAAWGAERCAAK